MKPYEIHFDAQVRELVPEPALSDLARDVLLELDTLQNSGSMARKHSTIRGVPVSGKQRTIKMVIARGEDLDAVHVTVPKSLSSRNIQCEECQQTGYKNLNALTLCENCHGLGYRTDLPSQSPL